MAWIRTIAESDAEGELARLFDAARDRRSGRVDEILRVHSLHPSGLAAHLALYTAAMRGTPGLSAVERELIAWSVSRINACHY